MTAKRWEIIDEEFISYTGGTAQLISNGECEIHLWERPKDAQLFCDKLNAINEEDERLKVTIQQLTNDNTKQKKLLNTTMKENEQLKTVINRYEKYSNKKNDELNFKQLDILKLQEENEELKQQLKDCTAKAKEEIRKQKEENAIRWANIGR